MTQTDTFPDEPGFARRMARMLWADKFALAAALFLLLIVVLAIIGPAWLDAAAQKQNLRGRNAPPFEFSRGWLWIMGADALGRPLLARIIVATQNTMLVAAGAVLISATVGSALGLVAGYAGPRVSQIIMRLADVIMSFPSLLIAVIVLYILGPSVLNLIIVLAITRIPVYLRTTRAEVLEVRERMFVQAAKVMGASPRRIVFRHILPVVLPTLMTIATLDFAFVMLAESSLSFLGIGIQPSHRGGTVELRERALYRPDDDARRDQRDDREPRDHREGDDPDAPAEAAARLRGRAVVGGEGI